MEQTRLTIINVDPGICGFRSRFEVFLMEKRTVSLNLIESECEHIQCLIGLLEKVSLREMFYPITENPFYTSAQRAGCHPACPIPSALVKGAEVVLDLALPRNISIEFEQT
jgi:hypothetical protein